MLMEAPGKHCLDVAPRPIRAESHSDPYMIQRGEATKRIFDALILATATSEHAPN